MLYLFAALLAAAAIGLDQLTKYLVVQHIALGEKVSLLPGIVHLTYIKNSGAAFSMLEGQRWPLVVLTVVTLGVIVFVLAKRYVSHPLGVLTLAAIAGGAVGNLIDRVRFGYVVDMIEVEFMHFAVFNVADMFVTCGGVLFCIYVIFFFGKDEKNRLGGASDDRSV
jgi:signal peptidase II